jgi:catechol 2,3-dioxygenase-like lactoylglutathione lyase family enzyme
MQESFPDRKPFFASTPAATPTRLIVADRLGWNEISEMFDHIGIVVGDLKRSARLYGGALEPLGLKILEEHSRGPNDGWVVISRGEPESPFFVVAAGRPSFWGPEARPSLSPVHLCFTAPSKEAVDRFHTLGLDLGARDNGAPGIRRPPFYCAFLIDFDGNNIEAGLYLTKV